MVIVVALIELQTHTHTRVIGLRRSEVGNGACSSVVSCSHFDLFAENFRAGKSKLPLQQQPERNNGSSLHLNVSFLVAALKQPGRAPWDED